MRLDRYTYSARLLPALIVCLPLLIFLFAALPAIWQVVGSVSAIGVSAAFLYITAQFGRDEGKRKETALFQAIGGKPSTCLLRHADGTLAAATKGRYHAFLCANAPGFQLLTPQQELREPQAADAMYDSATDWLRARTRDTKTHALLFAENISYGFRRNLWGLKPLGIVLCIAMSVATAGLFFGMPVNGIALPIAVTIWAVTFVQLYFWVFIVRPDWVAVPARAYAKALLEYCDK